MVYEVGERVLTVDELLIDGYGRSDFQKCDSTLLYRSVNDKLFTLPDDHLVYPAHDYNGRHVSSIAQKKGRNPRLGAGKSLEQFVEIMAALDLAHPKLIDYAVPGYRECGHCPEDLPQGLAQYCADMERSLQG